MFFKTLVEKVLEDEERQRDEYLDSLDDHAYLEATKNDPMYPYSWEEMKRRAGLLNDEPTKTTD